jgi:hypothetical protein
MDTSPDAVCRLHQGILLTASWSRLDRWKVVDPALKVVCPHKGAATSLKRSQLA